MSAGHNLPRLSSIVRLPSRLGNEFAGGEACNLSHG